MRPTNCYEERGVVHGHEIDDEQPLICQPIVCNVSTGRERATAGNEWLDVGRFLHPANRMAVVHAFQVCVYVRLLNCQELERIANLFHNGT